MGMSFLDGLSCEQLHALYKEYVERLGSVIKGTRNLLRNATDFIAFPFKRINALLDSYLDAISRMKGLLDLTSVYNIIKSLRKMLECPILLELFGRQIADILAAIENGAGAIKQMVMDLLNGVANMIRGALETIQNALQKPLKAITNAYDAFVKGTLSPIMQFLYNLEECLERMCAAYKAIQAFNFGEVIAPLKDFGIEIKDGELTVADDFWTKVWKHVKGQGGKLLRGGKADAEALYDATLERLGEVNAALKDLLGRAGSLIPV